MLVARISKLKFLFGKDKMHNVLQIMMYKTKQSKVKLGEGCSTSDIPLRFFGLPKE